MKHLIYATLLVTLSFAQNAYNNNKIDMHGGNHNSYGGFSRSTFKSMDMSKIVDRNTTKQVEKKKIFK